MSNWGSVPGYGETDVRALQEAAGITQFTGSSGWYQILNGILIQGGVVAVGADTSIVVPFQVAVPLQVLSIHTQPVIAGVGNGYGSIDPAGSNLQQFTLVNTGPAKEYYWLAIGV